MKERSVSYWMKNAVVTAAIALSLLFAGGMLTDQHVEAAGDTVSIIKINESSARVPASATETFWQGYRYVFRAVRDGETADDITGTFGNLVFHAGISEPVLTSRATVPQSTTVYEPYIEAIGLPDEVTLECVGARVKHNGTGECWTLDEAGIPEDSAKPYPVIEAPVKGHNRIVCIISEGEHNFALWAAFKLVDKNTGEPVPGTHTYGGITFNDGYSAEGDQSRTNQRLTTTPESGDPEEYWVYHFGNDDTITITELPDNMQIEVDACFTSRECTAAPEDLVVRDYPGSPVIETEAEYRVRHYLQEDGDDYSLDTLELKEGEIGDEITADQFKKTYPNHEFSETKSDLKATVAADGSTILNLYYDKKPLAKYTIEFWMQQPNGDYEIKDDWTEEHEGVIGETVDVDPDGYYVGNKHEPNYELSETSGVVKADGSLVLKLYYDIIKYTLEYSGGDGATGTMEPQKGAMGESVNVKDNGFTKYGYTFQYWRVENDSEQSYNPGDTFTFYNDTVLVAEWEEDGDPNKANYSVEHYYEQPDGSYEHYSTEDFRGDIDAKVSATPHEDNEWYSYYEDHPEGKRSGIITADNGLTLKLYYKYRDYTISYDGNGADSGDAPAPTTGHYEDVVSIASNSFVRTGYDFDGWNTKADGTGDDFSARETIYLYEDMVLYAQWVKSSSDANYTVKHYHEQLDGTYDLADTEHLSAAVGETVTASPKHYADYTLDDTQGKKSGKVIAEGDLVLELYYNLNRHTLKYDGNGADSGSMDDKTGKYGEKFNLAAVAFAKEGYDFTGWNTAKGGGETAYSDKAEFTLIKDTTLYAQWEKKSCKVSFDPDGGTLVDEQTVKHGEKATKPEDPTKEGFEFVKWTLNGDDYDFETPVTDNITLKAVWKEPDKPDPPEPTTHKITYKLDGGTYKGDPADIVETHELGSIIKVHEAPDARPGYTFEYWEGSKYYPGDDFTVEDDHVFTAVWKKDDQQQEKDPQGDDDPTTPDDGEDPTDPDPDKGSSTTDKGNDSARGKAATGDRMLIGEGVLVMLLAGAVAFATMRRRRSAIK